MVPNQIYLSHSQQDQEFADDVYRRLTDDGFRPWLFSREVEPGDPWEDRIKESIGQSALFIPLISEHWGDGGYFDTEVDLALELARTRRFGGAFIIPAMIRPTAWPPKINQFLGVELYGVDGWNRLIKSINRALGLEVLAPPLPPDGLVDAFFSSQPRPFVYVGAGLSAPMGLPTWEDFALKLLSWARVREIFDTSLLSSLYRSLDAGDADLVADSVVEAARVSDFLPYLIAYLREVFTDREVLPGPNHRRVRDLSPGAILTTNFDDLLELTFAGESFYTHADTEPLLDAVAARLFFVLKLYGTLNRPETVLVAPKQYEDEIVGNLAFSQFMENVFVSRTLLFLGASLEGIEAYLRGIKFRGTLSRQHYALVAVRGNVWQAKAAAIRRRYQIEVLPYTLSNDHIELDHFLDALAEKIRVKSIAAAPVAAPTQVVKSSSIARIRLENIGPFKDLEIQLDSRWNILIGDNGVGKSSIIRAIAVALCGRDAQSFANRLIRVDQPLGRIILEMDDGREYITQMKRSSTTPVVESLPTRLDAEGWLALGFPALRTVTWRPTRGPQLDARRTRPNPEDVLPLVVGAPDPRVDDLKQWLVDIDYRINNKDDQNGASYQVLREEFFKVLGRLAGGLKVEYGKVNMELKQVILITDDGEVPIESVSQGTISLLGWIGVLMQRLYEVYCHANRPIEQSALVLIDEIDAHMHPAWQLRLVPLLRDIFPKVQFIATTHSPLVVCNVGDGAVFRVERDGPSRSPTARRQQKSPAGMGVDGMLTSDYFGLPTQLDDETQKLLDQKVQFVIREGDLSDDDASELERVNRKLEETGLLSTFADPDYTAFLRALARRNKLAEFKKPASSTEDLERRRKLVDEIVAELNSKKKGDDAVR